jgi:transcriptional regulator with XRE-family HTH domain
MPERRGAITGEVTALLQERVGVAVRRLREDRGLTQEQLANAAGLAARHVQKIEAGEVNVTLRTLVCLGTALGVDAGILLGSPDCGEHK